MKWDQAEPGYVSTLPWIDCPFYLWFNNVGFCFFHNGTDSQEKRGFLCVKLQLGIWWFVRDSGKLLEQSLWISWPNFILCFEYICCYINLMIMKTLHCLIPTAQMRGGGGSLCWPVRESCYWYSWGKQISAYFAYLISVCFYASAVPQNSFCTSN